MPLLHVTLLLSVMHMGLWGGKAEVFKDAIVHTGGFHMICAYMGALGKSIRGSGFEDILIESNICAGGSSEVMSGKHNNHSLRVHKLVVEAWERFLL